MPKVSTTKGRKPDTTKDLKKKGTSKKIPRSKKRPEWDVSFIPVLCSKSTVYSHAIFNLIQSTSNDLNVHKLSKVEVVSQSRQTS